jgi:OPA family glycerol-3-phosphate transporter-like MFS transporter
VRKDKPAFLLLLLWAAYFVSDLGRLNYGAVLAEILRAEGYAKASAGLVSTGFFVSYGIGQLISGYAGDFLPSKYMILFGVSCSGLANLAMSFCTSPEQMLVCWCVNGAAQSTVWTPVLRIITEYFHADYRHKACVRMSTTYPVAALLAYAGCAGMVSQFEWRTVFRVTFVLMAAMSFIWVIGFRAAERNLAKAGSEKADAEAGRISCEVNKSRPQKRRLPVLMLSLICVALCAQGALRDGIMLWVPTYITSTFHMETSFSILSATLLPFVNLMGVYAGGEMRRRRLTETFAASVLFGTATLGTLLLFFLGQKNLAVSLAAFSLITSSMLGINLMLVSFVPTYFARYGKVSFVAGLLNSMVYVGSSISTYGIGAVADSAGWGVMLLILVGVAAAGGLFCFACIPLWRRFMWH